jgi:hypothetical protein
MLYQRNEKHPCVDSMAIDRLSANRVSSLAKLSSRILSGHAGKPSEAESFLFGKLDPESQVERFYH